MVNPSIANHGAKTENQSQLVKPSSRIMIKICSKIYWLTKAKFSSFEERGITSGGGLPSSEASGVSKRIDIEETARKMSTIHIGVQIPTHLTDDPSVLSHFKLKSTGKTKIAANIKTIKAITEQKSFWFL
mmetsp:Transcript_2774/g.3906  ORF Transcript_2774/g.3906 Transcript_2774/m.3906 type:complete len:130 (-) Transcript_2774:354-743(-)